MELVASLPPDLAALADPTARAAAPPLRPTAQDDAVAPTAVPFELLLGLLTAPLPGGESLPAAGNALPAAATDAPGKSAVATSALAKPVTSALPADAGIADVLARLKLAAAPAANDPTSAPPAQPVAEATASTTLPFADPESPSMQAVDATKAGAAATAPGAARTDLATALEAVLPPAASQDPSPKVSRAGQTRPADQAPGRLAAAAVTADLRADQGGTMAAPMPVTAITDSAARPGRREPALETFAVSATTLPADVAAPPAGATSGLAHVQAHVATGAAPASDASALAGQGAPIDTRAEHWHEALASRVQVLVDQHVGEAHIKLNPPELGSVDIKISLVDDKTFVQLSAGSSAARDELTQSLPRLRELLSASGLSFGGASVHGGGTGQSGQETAARHGLPAYTPFAAAEDDVLAPVRVATRAAGRIDLFA